MLNYVQAYDELRELYKKEKHKECDAWVNGFEKSYGFLKAPTWDYVCWLEMKYKEKEKVNA